jgi:hypothetical protein
MLTLQDAFRDTSRAEPHRRCTAFRDRRARRRVALAVLPKGDAVAIVIGEANHSAARPKRRYSPADTFLASAFTSSTLVVALGTDGPTVE